MMKFSVRLLVASLLLSLASLSRGQTVVSPLTDPPTVTKAIADFAVPAGTAQSTVNLKKTFSLPGLTGSVVRFSTTQGNIDVELLADDAPATVANFLSYANAGSYDGSFIHRSAASFVIQGGGYKFVDNNVATIPTNPPVFNEYKISNTRGTIAMAKLGGDPNSATDQWFFNEGDNSTNLNAQNGGFTVFGRIVGQAGLDVMDRIGALPVGNFGSPFDQLPVVNYTSGAVTNDNLVTVNSIAALPLTPKANGTSGLLKLKVKANSNPGLVTPDLEGRKLYLNFASGKTGSATITVIAKDAAKRKATTSFTVTVQ